MKKEVWFISGLGADKRAFQRLDFSGWHAHFVEWIPALSQQETIESYAKRLLAKIPDDNPIIVGYSFGGMIAIEMAKIAPVKKIVMVSSSKTRQELPPYFRLAGHVPVYRLVPVKWVKRPRWIYHWLFNTETLEDRNLLSEIIKDTDQHFLNWAMRVITQWQNTFIPENLVHIHGTADRVLPFKYVHADIAVQGGGHFMVANKAVQLSQILHEQIDGL